MGCRRPLLFCAALAVALSACSEQDQQHHPGISGPEVTPAAVTSTSVCSFSGIQQNIISYFPSNRQSGVLALKRSMEEAGEDQPGARDVGFEIMDSIGMFSRQFSLNATTGAQLTIGLIACMFPNQDTISYPADPEVAFSNALTKADGGAYYVRGGHLDGRSDDVLGTEYPSLGSPANLSGLEPLSGDWVTTLAGNAASGGRALIYGYRVASGPLIYEWSTVPSTATFSPAVAVSICDDDESATAMVHEANVGVLAYAPTTVCLGTQSVTMDDRGWGSRLLATVFARAVADLLSPAPLQATTLGKTGGGTATTFKSQVKKQTVSAVTLDWDAKPPSTFNGVDPARFPVSVTVSASSEPVFGVCVYLTGANNSGTPTELKSSIPNNPACNDPPPSSAGVLAVMTTAHNEDASLADFGEVGVTKTGGLIITATAKVVGRSATGTIFTKTNVKPAK